MKGIPQEQEIETAAMWKRFEPLEKAEIAKKEKQHKKMIAVDYGQQVLIRGYN